MYKQLKEDTMRIGIPGSGSVGKTLIERTIGFK